MWHALPYGSMRGLRRLLCAPKTDIVLVLEHDVPVAGFRPEHVDNLFAWLGTSWSQAAITVVGVEQFFADAAAYQQFAAGFRSRARAGRVGTGPPAPPRADGGASTPNQSGSLRLLTHAELQAELGGERYRVCTSWHFPRRDWCLCGRQCCRDNYTHALGPRPVSCELADGDS